jgi:nitric oxide synthase oxygenase domain/subunit
MTNKVNFAKLDIFKRRGVVSIDPKASVKKEKLQEKKNVNGKTVLEKWSIYVNPSYKRRLKIFATENNKKDYEVIDEALKEYIEKVV